MKRLPNKTIFALSTSYGQSAIAVYRISGNECKEIAYSLCKKRKLKERFAYYSNIFDLNGKLIDRGLIIFLRHQNHIQVRTFLRFILTAVLLLLID